MRKRTLMFSLVLVTGLLLSACGGIIQVEQPTPTVDLDASKPEAEAPAQDQPSADTPTEPTEGVQVETESGEAGQADSTVEGKLVPRPALGFEYGDSEIVATDPNQVELASGQLHLVELFAFW